MNRALVTTLAVAAAIFALGWADSAVAATRYAAPAGAAGGACTDAGAPCDIGSALEAAESGDGVELAPGVYEPPPPSIGALLEVPDGVHMYGASRADRAQIRATGRLAVHLEGSASLSDLDVFRSGEGNSGGLSLESGVVQRVRAITDHGAACYAFKGEIRSSLCVSTDPLYSGLSMLSFTSNSAIVVGSTIYGAGTGAVVQQEGAGKSSLLTLVNTIVRGDSRDVFVRASEPSSSSAANLIYSNYDPADTSTFGEGSTHVYDIDGNQSGVPLFADPAAFDFSQLEGSPTIDAGNPGSSEGEPLDVLGAPRVQNGVVDIGAYESTPPPLETSPPPVPPASPVAPSAQGEPPEQVTPNPPKCRGKRATIVAHRGVTRGTKRRDVIVGTPRRDVIHARGGADLVCGRGGNDLILGDGGRDVLLGQRGRDVLKERARPGFPLRRGGVRPVARRQRPRRPQRRQGTGSLRRPERPRPAPRARLPPAAAHPLSWTDGARPRYSWRLFTWSSSSIA